jgi:hypothetical protein
MSDQSQSWSYRDGPTVIGPLDVNALHQLHEAGVISDATEVARAGTEEWTPFSQAMLVGNVAPEPLPPAPKPLLRRDESVVPPAKEDSQPLSTSPPPARLEEPPLPPVPSAVPETHTPTSTPQDEAHGMPPTVNVEDAPQADVLPLPPVPPASAVPTPATPVGASIRIPCKLCGEVIEASSYDIGLQVPCPGCGSMATVSAAGAGMATSVGKTTPATANVPKDTTMDDGPLSDESRTAVPTWDVKFSSLLTGASGSGFAREGRLRIEDRNLVFYGWKLWNKALRVVIGTVLAIGLMWIVRTAIGDAVTQSAQSIIVKVFLAEDQRQPPYPDWVVITPFLVAAVICNVIPLYLAVLVSSYHLAGQGTCAFVATSRPQVKRRKLTMKIRPADGSGKSRSIRLWFSTSDDARDFQAHFEH